MTASVTPRVSRAIVAVAAVLVPVLVFRAVAVWEEASGWLPQDLRGALSDVAAALLAFAVVAWAGRVSKWLAVLLGLAWCLVHYGSYETVRALGAVPSYEDAHFLGSRTFLLGSVVQVSRPLLLGAVALASVAALWHGLGGLGARSSAVAAGGAALAALALAAWPPSDQAAHWRQLNLFEHNARILASELAPAPTASAHQPPDAADAVRARWPEIAADVSGTPLLPPGARARNVLLVVVESAAGGYLPGTAARFGFQPRIAMSRLDARAAGNIRYTNFLVNQVKTSRGLYTLLCGELPNLSRGVPKMTSYPVGSARRCLPRVLRDAGYETLYIQAAPLGFMDKKSFMPRAGFADVRGDAFFEHAYERSRWGVDDRAFYEQVAPVIADLDRRDAPWFVTTLNVSTHHPFVVPGTDRADRSRADAVHYADEALDGFLDDLGARGLLDDTLVVITTDESPGLGGPDGVWRRLTKNWGVLVVLLPTPVPLEIDASYSQMDVALSILDYLGLEARGRHFFGRSVFRRYDRGRVQFFAHGNIAVQGMVDAENRVTLCQLGSCRRYRAEDGSVFGTPRRAMPWKEDERELLKDVVRLSGVHAEVEPAERDTRMVDPVVELTGDVPKVLTGAQLWVLEEDEWLEIEFEVQATGSGEAELNHALLQEESDFAHAPAGDRPRIYLLRETLESGETLRFHYRLVPAGRVSNLEARTVIRSPSGAPWTFSFREANARIHRGDTRPEPGFELLEGPRGK